jgi:transcriptional regulator with XRE-family HTH domain
MTQQELAAAAGMHLTFVSRIENERQAPSLATIEALARAFGMEAWELLREAADRRARES